MWALDWVHTQRVELWCLKADPWGDRDIATADGLVSVVQRLGEQVSTLLNMCLVCRTYILLVRTSQFISESEMSAPSLSSQMK